MLIDIDYFKKINDLYGHKCGDRVLIELSQILEQNVRDTTIVSRWGGEEFLIIIEDADADTLKQLAERLRGVVEETIMIEEKQIHITVTIGGAVAHQNESMEDVLIRADKALYYGKENGRNQVTIDGCKSENICRD
ncbi:MAG: GGDEF domain-containing protein [Epsilonproteobacteria bacterium]|nr:GGDEF domain-containing protein [Campylobacterota bacterium]